MYRNLRSFTKNTVIKFSQFLLIFSQKPMIYDTLYKLTYLNIWIRTITIHLPFSPHFCLAETSMKTSEYSRIVIHVLIFSDDDGECKGWALIIILSLNNTSRFETEYTSSDRTHELLIWPEAETLFYILLIIPYIQIIVATDLHMHTYY